MPRCDCGSGSSIADLAGNRQAAKWQSCHNGWEPAVLSGLFRTVVRQPAGHGTGFRESARHAAQALGKGRLTNALEYVCIWLMIRRERRTGASSDMEFRR
jgi:hypothetical protein